MSTAEDYLTLARAASSEHVVQKSRFIAAAVPAASEEEALSHLKAQRAAYKAASHYCYAYIIGENAGIMRYQDDGEPSGTAGIPILEALRKNNVVNACIVVIRYFGGVLLGAGGLTRAYSHAANEAVKAAGWRWWNPASDFPSPRAIPSGTSWNTCSASGLSPGWKRFLPPRSTSPSSSAKNTDILTKEILDCTLGTALISVSEPFLALAGIRLINFTSRNGISLPPPRLPCWGRSHGGRRLHGRGGAHDTLMPA